MTKTDTIACLSVITATYPNLSLTEATVDAWAELLQDLPADVVRESVIHVLRSQKGAWWPTPGSVRQEAMRLLHQEWPSVDQAWGQVQRAIHRWGRSPGDQDWRLIPWSDVEQFFDPLVWRVVQSIGWVELCEGDPSILRGQFLRFYQAAQERVERDRLQGTALPSDTPVSLAQWSQSFGQGGSNYA